MMRKPANTRHRSRRDESGVQLAELAIVLPIFLVLLVAVAEFGLYFYTYTTLDKATRVGARYISSKAYSASQMGIARNLVVCGSTSACTSGTEILSGLTTGNVEITPPIASGLFPQTVTVKITGYNYQPIFDLSRFTGGASWQNVPVSPSTTMRYTLAN